MTSDLLFDLFHNGRWIGMAMGADEDAAIKMVHRSRPDIGNRFTLVRWHGRLHPDNCVTSGGEKPDPLPEPMDGTTFSDPPTFEELRSAIRAHREKVFNYLPSHVQTYLEQHHPPFLSDGTNLSYFVDACCAVLAETFARVRDS